MNRFLFGHLKRSFGSKNQVSSYFSQLGVYKSIFSNGSILSKVSFLS